MGFVTTTYVNHASPSALYAKTPYRFWYSDADMYDEDTDKIPEELLQCTDVAKQLFQKSDKIDLIMGGGRKYFRPANDPRYTIFLNSIYTIYRKYCMRKDIKVFN